MGKYDNQNARTRSRRRIRDKWSDLARKKYPVPFDTFKKALTEVKTEVETEFPTVVVSYEVDEIYETILDSFMRWDDLYQYIHASWRK